MKILDYYLPTEILCQIFAIYLSLKDLNQFDTAICNKDKRPDFLSKVCTYDGENNYSLVYIMRYLYDRRNTLTWLNRRGIKISSFMCSGFNEEEAVKIAGFGTSLTSLHFLGITDFDGELQPSFVKIMKSCPRLTSLKLGRFRLTKSTVSGIAEYCTGIKSLEICDNTDLTDASTLLLAKSCLQLESLIYLQPHSTTSLNLLSLQTTQFKSTKFLRFVETCKNLISLNLSMNRLNDAIVCPIAQSLSSLQVLDISHNNALTDISIISVANRCKQLKALNISYNRKLTNDSLCSLAEGCRQLQTLDISFCRGLMLNTESLLHTSRLLINLQNPKSDGFHITD